MNKTVIIILVSVFLIVIIGIAIYFMVQSNSEKTKNEALAAVLNQPIQQQGGALTGVLGGIGSFFKSGANAINAATK